MEALDKLGELSRSEDIRISGLITLRSTLMRKETTKEMLLWFMRILLQHILLGDSTTILN